MPGSPETTPGRFMRQLMDYYCKCGDDDPRTEMLIDALAEIERLRELLRGFRDHYGVPEWHDKVAAELGKRTTI